MSSSLDSIEQNPTNDEPKVEISRSIEILIPEKCNPNEKNFINLSSVPVHPIICVSDLQVYYSPSDVCNYISAFFLPEQKPQILLCLSKQSPKFIAIIKVESIPLAISVITKMKEKPTPILDMDVLQFDYFHSFQFDSQRMANIGFNFLQNNININQCMICFNDLHQNDLITLSCGHIIHLCCYSKMPRWECPICRHAPLSSISVPSCSICETFDRPFTCLICYKSFCLQHCKDHYKTTGHGYVMSTDGKETWNLMSDTSLQRIVLEKSGELVEMCAKSEQFQQYIEAAIIEQVAIHKALELQNIAAEETKIHNEEVQIQEEIINKKKEIERRKDLIRRKEKLIMERQMAQKILKKYQQNSVEANEDIEKLKKANENLDKEINKQKELELDLKNNALIVTAATTKGKNQVVHVKLNV